MRANQKGYTLPGLVIGTLVLLAFGALTIYLVNPLQILVRSRDKERKIQVQMVGEALTNYAKGKNGTIPINNKTWIDDLRARGELPVLPEAISYDSTSAMCKRNQQNGLCYATDTKFPPNYGIVYTKLESISENTKCDVSSGESAYYVYDMPSVRSGIVCTVGSEPAYNDLGQEFRD
jgi:hypothetical protein